jgi:hypothetical protein
LLAAVVVERKLAVALVLEDIEVAAQQYLLEILLL